MEHVVLVPGFWHGTWCWSHVTLELARRRIAAVAVDLPGQGLRGTSPAAQGARPFDAAEFATERSEVASVDATSAAEALIAQLEHIGSDRPHVVVAHSMGGVAVTLAAEMAPSLFSHLVYISALAPVSGQPAATFVAHPANAGELGTGLLRADPFAIGASRIDTADPATRERIREALYADVPVEVADAATSMLNADAPVGMAAEAIAVTRERFGSIPRTYVLCTEDRMLMPALQREIVRDVDTRSVEPTRVVELHSSHSPFLSQPQRVADIIHAAARPLDSATVSDGTTVTSGH